MRLIIFTRYPEPGVTKTRLIPRLGPEGAADLQRELTERTLQVAMDGQQDLQFEVEVRFVGGGMDRMRAWLGDNILLSSQSSGDLGAKMHHAFEDAFDAGVKRALLVGSDIPEISAEILLQAFHELENSDLVLGPAVDGGYYLVGLRAPCPELFTGIEWGTSSVLESSLGVAQALGLRVRLLRRLSDLDRPEDLGRLT